MNPKGDYLAAVSFCLGIIATATILNNTSEPLGVATGIADFGNGLAASDTGLVLDPGFVVSDDRVMARNLTDGSGFPILQPGVPVEVAVTWQVPPGSITADQKDMTLTIWNREISSGAFIAPERTRYFSGGSIAGVITVPVHSVFAEVSDE